MQKQINIVSLSYFAIMFACLMLPLKTSLSNFFILIFLTLSFIAIIIKGPKTKLLKKPSFYFATTLSLFIPILIATGYSVNMDKAILELTKHIFYLLLPFTILRKDLNKDKLIFWAGLGLILGSVISTLTLLGINFYNFLSSNLPIKSLFGYDYTGISFLAPLEQLHPIYLGAYYLFMLIILWQLNFNLKKGVKILITLLAVVTIIFLNSRIIFFIGVSIALGFIFKMYSAKTIILVVLSSVILFLLSKPMLEKTFIYNKMVNGVIWELTDNVATHNTDSKKTSDSRMSRWIVALDLIKEKPLLGYGTASEKKILIREYEKRKMLVSAKKGFDSHNQYLSNSLQYGLFGLLFLASFLFVNLREGIYNLETSQIVFIVIIANACLVENYLTRNMGINFVTLFALIFYHKNLQDD